MTFKDTRGRRQRKTLFQPQDEFIDSETDDEWESASNEDEIDKAARDREHNRLRKNFYRKVTSFHMEWNTLSDKFTEEETNHEKAAQEDTL